MRRLMLLGLVALGSMSAGCTMRSDGIYGQEVQKVLEAKGGDLAQCHAQALKADPSAAGSVMVHFKVAKDTGDFTDPQIVAEKTTAPESLQQCVLQAIPGLKLTPADTQRPADASYEFVFAPSASALASADSTTPGAAEPSGPPKLQTAPPPPAAN
ncbi:MAG: AgmX/PglI C-terminal domain-containing protein [Polyangiaceae bacterium]|nr:AgmX/PglI C-terminal domain-containing protein [Polyangiaceae bacterium]